MNNKIVLHSKTVGFSGTDKCVQILAKYMKKYDPYIVYRDNDLCNTRLEIAKKWIGDEKLVPYSWVPGKKGRIPPYYPEHDNFFEVVNSISPAVMHIHRSGYNEFPGFRWLAPQAKWIEHNIFGFNEHDRQMDYNIYISEFIRKLALKNGNRDGYVLYNPVEQPNFDLSSISKTKHRKQLLDKFSLPDNAILLGRVGRADPLIFDPISLKAFADIEKIYNNAYYLIVSPCSEWMKWTKDLKLSNVLFLEPIIDDNSLQEFYHGLDIYAHARSDGECCPTNIAEALMLGLPVVSHESAVYNGQAEVIGNAGFVVPLGDFQAYRDVLAALIENQEFANEDETGRVRLRDHFGQLARERAMRHFEASCITSRLEKIYDFVLQRT